VTNRRMIVVPVSLFALFAFMARLIWATCIPS
jgi:hypothetical protein